MRKPGKINIDNILKEMITLPDTPLTEIAATPRKPLASDFSVANLSKPCANKVRFAAPLIL